MLNKNKRLRDILVGSAATAVIVSSFAPAASAVTPDVPEGSKYYSAVFFLNDKYSAHFPDGTFRPHQQITRVDAAVLLAKVMELELSSAPASGFKDVPPRAMRYVNALKQMGIVKGKTADTFDSHALITRGELALWFQRTFEIFDVRASGSTLPFTDVSDLYADAVQLLVDNGVTNGKTSTTFGTTANATRGEYAIFLQRAYNVWRTASINRPGEGKFMQLYPSGAFDIVYGPKSGTKIFNEELSVIDIYGDAKGTITLRNIFIRGSLHFSVRDASFAIDSTTKVEGITYIANVVPNTNILTRSFTNNGTLGKVIFEDDDGIRFTNGENAILESLVLQTAGNVIVDGNIPSVLVEQTKEIQLEETATIGKIEVKSDVVIDIPEGAKIETLQADAIVEINGKGTVSSIIGSKADQVKGNNPSIK